ncbi:hypothetical protein CFOL_v3_25695 [Cephalotus follicularis]|uniref:Uncharacterized protein n=1 Tax=Cephalotus follicularis TaxID=3775 RepID=A0A1Q3CQ78_CEPFO|nr:hypothetical protein CFOL_v3_25695 [Cephalotus follicularis]
MEAIVSTRHLLMKFPTRFGVGEVRGDQQAARQCYKTAISDKGKDKVLPIANVELRGDVEPERPQPVEDVLQVPMEEGNNEKVFQVGSQLREAEKGKLITFLRNNKDDFAWSAEEVPRIIPDVMVHKLSVDPVRHPTRQKKRNFVPERQQASRGGEKAIAGRVHKGSALLRLAGESSTSQKSKWQMEDVHRLHRPQQNFLKGSLPSPKDRPAGRCNLGLQNIKILGRLLGI